MPPPAPPRDAHHVDGHGARSRGQLVERTALARLAADEQSLQRRYAHVHDFGCTWLRPPGVPKTLHQMREEKREQEEHQEALRREQLAQELAEAEAAALPDNGLMDDVQLDGAHDLDDEIPDADDPFGLDEDDDDDDDGETAEQTDVDDAALREEHQNDLMATRMRMTDDAFREALVRGEPDGDDMYGGEDDELDQQGRAQMLDEDDFARGPVHADDDTATGLDMDANLDDDIPKAGSAGGYEHTDSEADLGSSTRDDDDDDDDDEEHRGGAYHGGSSSSDDADDEVAAGLDAGPGPRTAPLGPPQSPTAMMARQTGASSSARHGDDESSFAQSSPAQSRRARYG